MTNKTQARERLFSYPPDAASSLNAVMPPVGLEPPAGGFGGATTDNQHRKGLSDSTPLNLPGMEWVSAADFMKSTRKARRECGETGHRLLVLDSWSDFLASKMPPESDFVTYTWRETKDPMRPKGHYTPKGCFRDVRKLAKDCRILTPSFYVAEPHRWLETLHVHGLIRHLNPTEHDLLFRCAVHRFGRTQILPANPAAFPYVCKYMFKEACCSRHDYIDLSGLRCDL